MHVTEKKYTIAQLVEAFCSGTLLRNAEYQRGEAWSDLQKASFVDSIFRSYPVPVIYLRRVETTGLDDVQSFKHEIVDGQQRLTALRDFVSGKFKLEDVGEDSRLRLPRSVQMSPAPWAGRLFGELPDALSRRLKETEISVYMIAADAHEDEVRDLFIRLQSGTALTRQQIRDAWPGTLGPFIERLAGKLDRRPTNRLFGIIDKRGSRIEEEDIRDTHVTDRQICAQLLRIFLAREYDPGTFPSVSAGELDNLYHEHTDFDSQGKVALRFIECLERTADVFEAASKGLSQKTKFLRLDVASVMMLVQDLTHHGQSRLGPDAIQKMVEAVVSNNRSDKPGGKSTSGKTLEKYYHWFRSQLPDMPVIRLDPQRVFDCDQQREIDRRDESRCGICGELVAESDAEYDHYPTPWHRGGVTESSNGRLVHARCHPRGRPAGTMK